MLDDEDDLEIETINLVPEDHPALEPAEAIEPLRPHGEPAFEPLSAPASSEPVLDPALDQAAREADSQLNHLLHVFQEHVTQIAQLVHRIRAQGLYRNLGHETFEAYIRSKELRMSRSFIYQLAKVGEVIDNAGVDLEALPAARELQISKLAQIARLPEPDTHRKVLETGKITLRTPEGREEEVSLNEVPVKKLNAHINERLGLPTRLQPAYDPQPEPAYHGAGPTGLQNAAAYATVVSAERTLEASVAHSGWPGALDRLVDELRRLEGGARREAVAEIVRVCQATVSDSIPF